VLVIDFCAIQILVDLALKPAKQFWEMHLQAKWQFQVRQLRPSALFLESLFIGLLKQP